MTDLGKDTVNRWHHGINATFFLFDNDHQITLYDAVCDDFKVIKQDPEYHGLIIQDCSFPDCKWLGIPKECNLDDILGEDIFLESDSTSVPLPYNLITEIRFGKSDTSFDPLTEKYDPTFDPNSLKIFPAVYLKDKKRSYTPKVLNVTENAFNTFCLLSRSEVFYGA